MLLKLIALYYRLMGNFPVTIVVKREAHSFWAKDVGIDSGRLFIETVDGDVKYFPIADIDSLLVTGK